MKKRSLVVPTIFLQTVIVLIGIGVFVALLWEPRLEGRNVNATPFEIYFQDPFLAYVYLGSIPLFVGLYQAFKVLGYAGQHKTFQKPTVKALRTIKYCALITAGTTVAANAILLIAARGNGEDAAGAVALGIVATFASIVIGTAAMLFERIIQNAMDARSENDLTV